MLQTYLLDKKTNCFSYVDTTLRIIYFNIESLYDQDYVSYLNKYIESYDNASFFKGKLLEEIIDFNITENVPLSYIYFHEWHHYLQSLAYPFLYYLSWIELKTILNVNDFIRLYNEDIDLNKNRFIRLNNEVYNNINYQIYNFEFCFKDKLLCPVIDHSNPESDTNVFCITDLIENCTSIFHYKILKGETSNADEYWIWLRNPRNKTYKNLFYFLAAEIGYKETYDLFPLLTLLSFYVTEPLHAFCTLFNHRDLFTDNVDHNLSIGKLILASSYRELDFKNNDYLFIQHIPVGMISDEQFSYLIEFTKLFPISSPALRFHKDRANMEKILLSPNLPASFEYLVSHYYPMAIHFNFTDFISRDTAFVYHMDQNEISGIKSELYISELAKLKDITLSLIGPFNDVLPRNCHHINCPYFEIDLCHRWNAIPIDFNMCNFPSWFAINFNKEIIPHKKKLTQLSVDQIKSFKVKYDLLNHSIQDKMKWQFHFDKNNSAFTLFIFKETVDNMNVDYVISFFNMIIKKYGFEKVSSSVSFKFHGYDNDTSIIQIKEIDNWFRSLKDTCPELFFFIDLKPQRDNGYILYYFIDHTITWPSKNSFELNITPQNWRDFLVNEFEIFRKFCYRNNLDTNYYFLKAFNNE